MAKRELMIGAIAATAPAEKVTIAADALNTHGVIVGMTGSGKTGLAIVMLEELARQKVPLVICDLKGDLADLLLAFPHLTPAEFAPYLPAATPAEQREAAAGQAATRWRNGLSTWGLGEADIAELRSALAWQLLTPGSGLAPVDLLPALSPPPGYDPDLDPDAARGRLDGTAAGLLALVDRGGDPLTDRDHVLLTTLLDAAWRSGQALDLPELIRRIVDPPVSQFGVLDAETFYPRKERQELVLAFNTVLASPSFSVWTRGVPLAAEQLIGPPEAPKGTILALSHLGERERMSFLTLLFSTLLSWARRQPGSESLRVLLYLDEVQGIVPPSALPPTKPPLLTLLKQGRAFGAGVLLATQNPVDLDYKALGNIGLKLIGRLDTDNDRKHALQGLDLGEGDLDATVAGLKQREFVLAGARAGAPRVITSRWAMSYLRGPLTLAELKPLLAAGGAQPAGPPPAPAVRGAAAPVLPGVDQLFGAGETLRPAVLIEARVLYRKAAPALQREVDGAWLAPLAGDGVDWERLAQRELPALDDALPPGSTLAPLPGNAAESVRAAAKEFVREIAARPLGLTWHRALKLVQETGEDDVRFRERCLEAARAGTQDKAGQVRTRYEGKLRQLDQRLGREELELSRDQQELANRERQKTVTIAAGVGDALLQGIGVLLGGRRSGWAGAARKGASTYRQTSEQGRMTDRARAEVAESEQQIAAIEAEKQNLAQAMQQEIELLGEQAERLAGQVEPLPVTPGSRDITVRRVALAWLPDADLA
jgi:Helicase HerA, central domain